MKFWNCCAGVEAIRVNVPLVFSILFYFFVDHEIPATVNSSLVYYFYTTYLNKEIKHFYTDWFCHNKVAVQQLQVQRSYSIPRKNILQDLQDLLYKILPLSLQETCKFMQA